MARQFGSLATPSRHSLLVTEGCLETELPHTQLCSLFSYFKNFRGECQKGEYFIQFSSYFMTESCRNRKKVDRTSQL
jgi:hypothetical protein